MYSVLDICRYVINYSNKKDYGVSNLKLQKVLYFIQAHFLLDTDSPEACFVEPIEAWDFGPVVPIAYHEYKHFGSSDIPSINSYLIIKDTKPLKMERVKYDDDIINDKDKARINEVVDVLSDYTASDLVKITHDQAPWKNAYRRGRNSVISHEEIKEYFEDGK